MSESFWSKFFWVAGAWNVVAALAFAAFPAIAGKLLFGDESGDPLMCFQLQLFALAVGAFGIGYGMVAFDLHENRAIVQLGGVCKVVLFLMSLHAYSNGFGTPLLLTLTAGDVIWAGLFGVFLIRARQYSLVERGHV